MTNIHIDEHSKTKITGYALSRNWFNFAFENPDKIKPTHGIIYFFMVETCNRLGWKEKFGFPTIHSMEATGIKSKTTYGDAVRDLIDWGFVKLIQKSRNANTANIISLFTVPIFRSVTNTVDKSVLDTAIIQNSCQQVDRTLPIDKPDNSKPIKPRKESFEPPSLKAITEFVKKNSNEKLRGKEEGFAETFFYYYEEKEWKSKDKTIIKWESKLKLWIARKNNPQQTKDANYGNTNPKETKAGRTSRTVAEDFADFPVIHN